MILGKLRHARYGLLRTVVGAFVREHMEMAQLIYPKLLDGHGSLMLVDIDEAYRMGIGLVATNVERAARISHHRSRITHLLLHAILLMAYGLRLMDVAEGQVVVALAKLRERLRLELSDLKIMPRCVEASHCRMAHHHHRLAFVILLRHLVEKGLQLFAPCADHVWQGHNVSRLQANDEFLLPSFLRHDRRARAYDMRVGELPHLTFRL